jgi:hypothetical protein
MMYLRVQRARLSLPVALPPPRALSSARASQRAKLFGTYNVFDRGFSARGSAQTCCAVAKPWASKEGRLVLADGTVLKGRCFGTSGFKVAEIVFNTSMSGYQEIMTDPSYRDQMVCFTHPHIGNVGINDGAHFISRYYM